MITINNNKLESAESASNAFINELKNTLNNAEHIKHAQQTAKNAGWERLAAKELVPYAITALKNNAVPAEIYLLAVAAMLAELNKKYKFIGDTVNAEQLQECYYLY